MMEYKNPVLPGFHPDPSVCSVDGIFFAATSTFGFFPGIPIYVSNDLVNWKQIGNVIQNQDQGVDLNTISLNFPSHGGVYMGGLFAPTLRYHNGRFYCICTNLIDEVPGKDFYPYNFICYTDDIWSGKWSKANYIPDFYAIDPSLFWDDDGTCYVQGAFIYGYDKEIANSIHQFQINPDTGERLSEEYEICPGWDKTCSEGPHMYKKDDWYYLIFAEGGTFDGHMLCIARSKTVQGPFEPYENNPIATNKFNAEEYVQWVGHGEIFCDNKGQYWAMLLAGRNTLKSQHPLGRESFLSPVEWPTNGWPKVETIKVDMKVSHEPPTTKTTAQKSINDLVPEWFSKDLIATHFFIRQPKTTDYQWDGPGTHIRLKLNPNGLDSFTGPISFVGNRQPDLDSKYEIKIHVTQSTLDSNTHFGICVYKDPPRYYELGVDTNTNTIFLAAKTLSGYNKIVSKSIPVAAIKTLKFKIVSTEQEYKFYAASESEELELIGSIGTEDISWDEFTGTIYGVYSVGKDSCIEFEEINTHEH